MTFIHFRNWADLIFSIKFWRVSVQTIYSTFARRLTALMLAAMTVMLASCGPGGTPVSSATAAATVNLTALPVTVKSDGSTTTTITATVLNSSNTVLSGQVVNFSSSTGQLGTSSGDTDTNGVSTVAFSAGPSGINRTATITATSGTASSQILVQIVDSTVTANPASASVLDDGSNTATVTFTALNASGAPVSGTAITVSETGIGNITFTPATGATDANGKFVVTVTGVAGGAGLSTLTAAALGATASMDINVTVPTSSFSISGLSLNGTAQTSVATNAFSTTSMRIGQSLLVTATAPAPASSVTFASTMGNWASTGTHYGTAAVAGGVATDTLTTTQAGVDNVQVFDTNAPSSTDALTVAMTAVTPNAVTLQATPSVVPKTTGTSSLIATVTDVNGAPVGGVPVGFSIVNPTGGGESISPVVVYTATSPTASLALGQASTTFTAGSSSSSQGGVKARAQVLGTAVVTNTAPSGSDASVVIGGSPSSVAFGQATTLGINSNGSQYILAMSVFVSDSNGNPAPVGTVVNLSLWPIAWSTGSPCLWDPDDFVWDGSLAVPAYVAGNGGTFYNEDANENLVLNTGEDGIRNYYYKAGARAGGTVDTYITPANSDAGTIPATVTTDATGTANFDLIYPKTSALYVIDRIRGRTVVQGTDAVGETQFRLSALESDLTPCRLPASHFRF
ncbi:MAG: Ig-like domain-containing protein [Nitrosomonadales bacterium]|nr:Ig-like domain-containing protein [Nitrosomonadales bacterium]